ncbi:MAG: response regulator transcription factor [Tissierellia bacterium]|nr:response regulator transcription factor [Tissierellia bacterium]
MKKILIVENDGFLRDLLTDYFNATGNYKVVASIGDASLAPTLCSKNQVDLALMDICTNDDSRGGIIAAGIIKNNFPHIKVMLMTGVPEADYMKEAKAAGVDSFIYKTDTIEKLLEAVEDTMLGDNQWPELLDTPLKNFNFSLSPREQEVARMICCECLTRQEIAHTLSISPDTVKTVTSRIIDKVGVENIRQLISYMLINEYFK